MMKLPVLSGWYLMVARLFLRLKNHIKKMMLKANATLICKAAFPALLSAGLFLALRMNRPKERPPCVV